jgi:hypothetical protein
MASQSRNPSHRLVEALSALFVVALTSPAAAQSSSSTAAQALFDQARILLEAGQVAEACPKFEESQRLDPGSGTLLNLATCYEKSGRLASAWTTYLEAASASKASGNSEREGVAREQAAALAPRLSFLIVKVGEAARGVRGLQITRDGESVGPAQWDLPVPADSGDHTVVATATGYKSWKASATVKGEGQKTVVTVPVLERDPNAAVVESPSPDAASTHLSADPWPQRRLAIIAAGVGVVGLGVATGFGFSAKSTYEDSKSHCSETNVCNDTGLDLRDNAFGKATIATVAFGIGLAGLVGGAALWFTAPTDREQPVPKPSARLGMSPGVGSLPWAVTVRGTW